MTNHTSFGHDRERDVRFGNDWISDEIWDEAEDRQPNAAFSETRDSLADTLLEDVSQADTAETMLPPELTHRRSGPPRPSH